MSVKAMDQVFSRWFLDGEFRAQLNENLELALDGYDLTEIERVKLSMLSRKNRRRAKAKKNAVNAIPPKLVTVSSASYTRPTDTWTNFNLN